MLGELIVIKFGGSVITDKTASRPKVRLAIIQSLAKQLSKLYLSGKWRMILVHGGGSFGHPIARRYGLDKGMTSDEEKIGFSKTLYSMLKLNDLIIGELIKNNVPAVAIPPHSFVEQDTGMLKKLDSRLIKFYLDQDIVPVLFGDGVLDKKWGCSILSGDTIVTHFAKKLRAKKVLFLSDVDGIYEQDPKINSSAQRINNVGDHNLQQVLNSIVLKNKKDVTGEMKGKILSIKKNLRGIEVIITSGIKDDSLLRAVEKRTGTRLRFN